MGWCSGLWSEAEDPCWLFWLDVGLGFRKSGFALSLSS